jgi:ParB family chromosome partitioning protein
MNRVCVADVLVRDRLRPVGEAGVASLIASIEQTGVMKDAVHVRKKKDGKLHLIAGAHRLEAARRLGWEEVEAKVWTDVTDDWARLMEVDDNLAGAEMNPLDTAIFLARRKEIYERMHPETKAVAGAALAAKRWDATDTMSVASFVTATAEKFSLSERHVRRMIAAGHKLQPDETARLRRAPRAITLKDLIEISKVGDPTERYAVVDALVDGTAKKASEARKAWKARETGAPPVVKDPVEAGFKAMMLAWSRAPKAAKKRFCLEFAKELWDVQNRGVPLTHWSEATEE